MMVTRRQHASPIISVGSWAQYRECHIEPDWLLIYVVEDDCVTFLPHLYSLGLV